jgi:hypothetical protein
MPFLGRTQIAEDEAEPVLKAIAPAHLERLTNRPSIRVHAPGEQVLDWFLAVSLGGGKGHDHPRRCDELHVVQVEPEERDDGLVAIPVPAELWKGLRTNMGYWWVVYALTMDGHVLRTSEVRCMIRHAPISRLIGSTLTYPDQEARPLADLGGAKAPGWASREQVQRRPAVLKKPSGLWADPQPFRHKRRKRQTTGVRK